MSFSKLAAMEDTVLLEGVPNAVVLAGGVVVSFVAYAVGTVIYRVWFHPLAKMPGPKLWAASDVPNMYLSHIKRELPTRAVQLHRKYGPMVRIGPDRILVDGSVAWSKIHGLRNTNTGTEFIKVPKSLFADDYLAIIGAGREDHRRQRRHLAHAFSSAALHEQEDIIRGYVDKLVAKVESCARQGSTLNMVSWFNYTTFDVIGDLTFAEPFGSLDGNTTFVDNAFRGLIGNSILRFLTVLPLMRLPLTLIMGSAELKAAQEAGHVNNRLGREKCLARIAMDDKITESGRRDFATYFLKRGKDGAEVLSSGEMQANSQIIVLAGSETTATALAGAMFFLGRPENAPKLRIMVDEIRGAFADDGESAIDMISAARLEYLHAVIEESLRMYPPAAGITPRQSPGAEVNGYWLPPKTSIMFSSMATYRNPAYFKDPDTFVPERWLNPSHPLHNPSYDSDHKDYFKPFSAGPRDCLGKNLAYAEMHMILARLFLRFEFEVLPGQDDWISKQRATPLIWLKGGLEVRPRLRDGATQ